MSNAPAERGEVIRTGTSARGAGSGTEIGAAF